MKGSTVIYAVKLPPHCQVEHDVRVLCRNEWVKFKDHLYCNKRDDNDFKVNTSAQEKGIRAPCDRKHETGAIQVPSAKR